MVNRDAFNNKHIENQILERKSLIQNCSIHVASIKKKQKKKQDSVEEECLNPGLPSNS